MIKTHSWTEGVEYRVERPIIDHGIKWYPIIKIIRHTHRMLTDDSESLSALALFNTVVRIDVNTVFVQRHPTRESNVEYFQTSREADQFCKDHTTIKQHSLEYFEQPKPPTQNIVDGRVMTYNDTPNKSWFKRWFGNNEIRGYEDSEHV